MDKEKSSLKSSIFENKFVKAVNGFHENNTVKTVQLKSNSAVSWKVFKFSKIVVHCSK